MQGYDFHGVITRVRVKTIKRYRSNHKVWSLASVCVLALSACEGALQLCGEYACVYYQSDCHVSGTCHEPSQCESASSIRDRAPRILNELRTAQRSCKGLSQDQNQNRLVWDEQLGSASESHSKDMAQNRYESFTGSNGISSTGRVELTGFNAKAVVENISSGQQTVAEVINHWLDNETDCNNMLSTNTSKMGMACTLSDEPDRRPYWSLILADPDVVAIQR